MTEYEIADLAASKAFEVQSAVSLIQTQLTMMTDIIQQYMSLLFAYIVAAHFFGANLSRRQMWIFTTLYVVWQAWMTAAFVGRARLMMLLIEAFQEIQDATSPSGGGSFLIMRAIVLGLLVASLFASLYFMWTVRHPKTE
jgi:hypothetical protein